MKRSIAWGIGITLAAAVPSPRACGNSISDTSGSGGKGTGGQGTPTSSSQAATTGGMGGSGGSVATGGSGGMGGGDVCTKACAHADGCNEDICSQFPLDCSNSQDACVAACINARLRCDDIMKAVVCLSDPQSCTDPGPVGICALPCLQGGTGGGGQGGNGAGGGSAMACEHCAENACMNQLGACGMDMSMNGCQAPGAAVRDRLQLP